MSNLGLEHALAERGIEFRRAQVGDRHVLAMLQRGGRHARRRDLRAYSVPGQDHHRRWPDQRPAGARRHEEARAPVSPSCAPPMPQVSPGAAERAGRAALRSHRRTRASSTVADAVERRFEGRGPHRAARLGHRAADPGHGRGLRCRAGRRRARATSPRRSKRRSKAERPRLVASGLAVTRSARLIFAAFPAGADARRWWLCVVRWSRVIGKCTDRGPPTRRCSPIWSGA